MLRFIDSEILGNFNNGVFPIAPGNPVSLTNGMKGSLSGVLAVMEIDRLAILPNMIKDLFRKKC